MGDDDDSVPFVFDLGSHATRFGEAGDDAPSVEFENQANASIADRISKALGNKQLKEVVVSLPALAPTQTVEVVKVLFDKFGVTSVLGASSNVLALLSKDKDTGLVVDVGVDSTSLFPMLYGLGIQEGLLRAPIGGKNVTERLKEILKQNGVTVSESEADQIKRNAKASQAQSSVSFKRDNGSEGSVQVQYKWVADSIDAFIGNKDVGLVSLLVKSLQRLEEDARGNLISTIYLVGGGASFEGIAAKIETKLNEILKTKKAKIVNASEVAEWRLFPWKGASILGSLSSLKDQYITKQEYLKYKDGQQLSNVLHQKWNTFPNVSEKTKESERCHLTYKFSPDYAVVCPYDTLAIDETGCNFTGTRSKLEAHLVSNHPKGQPTRQILPVWGETGAGGGGNDDGDDGGIVFEEVNTTHYYDEAGEEEEEELIFFDTVKRG